MSFVHLHVHSVYSLLDGFNKIEDIVNYSKKMGMPSVALTDHNNMGGIPDFISTCREQGVKPLCGVEGYFTPVQAEMMKPVKKRQEEALQKALDQGFITKKTKINKELKKEIYSRFGYDMTDFHILFIAKNNDGWHNLIKLQSEAARLCTFNGRYHVDYDLCKKYHKNIICTCACIGSFSAAMIDRGDYDEAIRYLDTMYEIFGNDFYLEIQPYDVPRQHKTNLFYMEYAKSRKVACVATNDSHWTLKKDAKDHDVLICIATGKKLEDTNRMKYAPDFWLRSEDEMLEAFQTQADHMCNIYPDFEKYGLNEYLEFCQEAINNTVNLSDTVQDNIELKQPVPLFPLIPSVQANTISRAETPEVLLVQEAMDGLNKYLDANPKLDKTLYKQRLEEELEIICEKGYASYFLVVQEYIRWCDDNGIATGPGRGSAAGSLTLLMLGITKNIDPIEHDLLFSRFLSKDRKTSPDIDTDFSWLRRDEVIKHLEEIYGAANVSHIGTFSTMRVKSGIKDVCRVLNLPFTESNDISKRIDKIDMDPNLSFKMIDSWKDDPDELAKKKYNAISEIEQQYKEIFRLARRFEGIPRQQGVHASGILVTPVPITDVTPVWYKDGVAVTTFSGVQLEDANLVKFDILGLKTLDVIQQTLSHINPKWTMNDLYKKARINDVSVYKLIQAGKTEGVFQLESGVMKQIIKTIKPEEFNDLIAINALARPGPLSCKMHIAYASGKKNNEEIKYPISGCNDILDKTYGTIPFQEQLMHISQKVAGFNGTQADSLMRKIIAKKKPAMMAILKRCFLYGKKNQPFPSGTEDDPHSPWYDPHVKYGEEIPGAINRGYSVQEIERFFEIIEPYTSYCFNKSHAATYAYLGFLTAWLKKKYPIEFYAAAMSIDDEDHRTLYAKQCLADGIKLKCPSINLSINGFLPRDSKKEVNALKDEELKEILYGFNSIKGVGASFISELLRIRAQQSFDSFNDFLERVPVRKNVMIPLIKAGVFDEFNTNRYAILYNYLCFRREKDINPNLNTAVCTDDDIMSMETEVLGHPVSILPHYGWNDINVDASYQSTFQISSIREIKDKKGGIMAFLDLTDKDGCKITGIIFASKWSRSHHLKDKVKEGKAKLAGTKSKNESLIIDTADMILD